MDDSEELPVKQLSAIEIAAEDILSDRQQIVILDNKRNKCREAIRAQQKQSSEDSTKSWVCFGNTFIKMDTSECMKMLETDQKTINDEINKLRNELKHKVNQLHKMEGRPELKGFDLEGINIDQLLHVTQT